MAATMNWKEPDTKIKFLVAVLASNDSAAVKEAKATQIAEYMGCSAKAVSHQLTALRKEIESLRSGDFVSGVAAKGTPKGASSAAKRKSKDEGVDGADDAGTPSKKAKATKATKKKSAKAKQQAASEEDEDDGDGDVAARKAAANGDADGEDED
ncbi:hypothetical protein LTR70_009304 [Exophiala xenobiotica]|uniref:Uncharacterized protein n=1 Tax=Lithohypha guttulata TaxID=1690604 RepID=A0ABR0JXV6_9EURO|nr:hypothetical protein LTR24_009141 [Lithohypha guttulata]KAK5310662.1 hypothetical protein LTR70_009304 [Exophiala xenobiotica]